jgi:hypothetical protein
MPHPTPEHLIYIAIFVAGLLISVYVMLHGSIRHFHDPATATPPPAAFNTPVIGAILMAFGAVGYLVSKYSPVGTIYTILIALLGAAVAWVGVTTLLATWAYRGPIADPHEELEELQGTVAQVTRRITADALGEISYIFRGQPLRVAARSIDGSGADVGTEVVIEKIEGGVADVELWSIVEQRI